LHDEGAALANDSARTWKEEHRLVSPKKEKKKKTDCAPGIKKAAESSAERPRGPGEVAPGIHLSLGADEIGGEVSTLVSGLKRKKGEISDCPQRRL